MLNEPVNLHEFEPLARANLTPMAFDYLAGGGGDEVTIRWNRDRLAAVRLAPRVLSGVSQADTRLRLLGVDLPSPILLAPAGYQRLFHADGELATVRAAGASGTLVVASTVATTSIEALGEAARGPIAFQLYVQRDRGFTADLVARAEAAGCRWIVWTVDTPVLGSRDRDTRNRLELPPGVELANLKRNASPPETPTFDHSAANPFLDPTLTWDTLPWLRAHTRLPIIVKGVLRPDDARRALEGGADAIAVSNHGGRNLDTVPASIDALPRVADAIQGRVPLLFDGGVRRGVDVVKAMARGASAVMIGRPYLWGLAAAGEAGVARVIALLRTELEQAMVQCGAATLADIDRGLLWD